MIDRRHGLIRFLKTPWLYWSAFCVACWVPWVFFSKLGSDEIPTSTMQYLYNLGGIPVGLACLMRRRFRVERDARGISIGLVTGVLSAFGQIGLFAAFRTGANTAVVTVMTSLYPVVTVILAFFLLRERLTVAQSMGLAFAVAAFVLFSL